MRLLVCTHFPSPYQTEYLNAIARGVGDLKTVFIRRRCAGRPWAPPPISFRNVALDEGLKARQVAEEWFRNADLVVMNWYRDPLILEWMRVLSCSSRPWVFWAERPGFKWPRAMGGLYRRVSLRALRRTAAPIWGIGAWAVEAWKDEFGGGRRYENVPYCSDLERFHNITREVSGLKTRRSFIFSGRLNRRKGFDLVLRAAELLCAERQESFHVVVAGDGPLYEEAQSLARRLCGVFSLLGFVPWDRLQEVYARGDVLLAPSRYDGWNLAVPEGLASGLPVISTVTTGAARDLVHDGGNGWLIPANNLRALVNAMKAAMEGSGFEAMQAEARLAAAEHSLAAGVRRFAEACERARCACSERGRKEPTS